MKKESWAHAKKRGGRKLERHSTERRGSSMEREKKGGFQVYRIGWGGEGKGGGCRIAYKKLVLEMPTPLELGGKEV